MSTYAPIESDNPTQPVAGNSSNPNEWSWGRKLRESSHPVALLFYIFFRVAPIFLYIFGTLVIGVFTLDSKFILHFITTVLLVLADFWNLKNIAGRLLVGLRWWNETNLVEGSADVENVWVFETADPERYINPVDSRMFWLLLYIQPFFWAVLAVLALLKFEFLYLLLIIIAFLLSATNAMAFTKCDKFSKANGLAQNLLSQATGGFFSKVFPFFS